MDVRPGKSQSLLGRHAEESQLLLLLPGSELPSPGRSACILVATTPTVNSLTVLQQISMLQQQWRWVTKGGSRVYIKGASSSLLCVFRTSCGLTRPWQRAASMALQQWRKYTWPRLMLIHFTTISQLLRLHSVQWKKKWMLKDVQRYVKVTAVWEVIAGPQRFFLK